MVHQNSDIDYRCIFNRYVVCDEKEKVKSSWHTTLLLFSRAENIQGMFAIPASMLTWGFEAEAERCAKLARMR